MERNAIVRHSSTRHWRSLLRNLEFKSRKDESTFERGRQSIRLRAASVGLFFAVRRGGCLVGAMEQRRDQLVSSYRKVHGMGRCVLGGCPRFPAELCLWEFGESFQLNEHQLLEGRWIMDGNPPSRTLTQVLEALGEDLENNARASANPTDWAEALTPRRR